MTQVSLTLRTTRSALLIFTADILRSDSTWVALALILLLIHVLVDVSPVRNRWNFQDDLWLCYVCPLALFWRPSVISSYCAGPVPLVYSQSKNLMLICWPTILAISCWDTSTFAFKNPRFRIRPWRFKKKMNRSQCNWPPHSVPSNIEKHEAILVSGSDVNRKEKRTTKSCHGVVLEPKRDCCKIVILGIKRKNLSYRHFSSRILFLRANNSWNVAILKLLSRFFCFQDFYQHWQKEDGKERAFAVLALREVACEVICRKIS